MRDIQEALYNSTDWMEWRDNIINSAPQNPTTFEVEDLFNQWYQ